MADDPISIDIANSADDSTTNVIAKPFVVWGHGLHARGARSGSSSSSSHEQQQNRLPALTGWQILQGPSAQASPRPPHCK
eukprot:jgi/Chrpa1/27103/Chrysochromulina_OHIO_Genome00027866-RA